MNKKIIFFSSLSIVAVFWVILFFNSCEKNDLTRNIQSTTYEKSKDLFSHVSVKNGVLCFDSAHYVSQIASALQKMSLNERKEWESKMAFRSMRTCIDETYIEMDDCSTIEEYNSILSLNSDINVV